MPRWLAPFAISCLALLFLWPATALADGDKEKAVKLLAKGDKLLSRGDRAMEGGKVEKALSSYEEALDQYEKAYEAFPNPKIYFPIALAEQKLGRYLESMRHYQKMIKGSDNPGAEAIEQVDAAIAEVRKNLVALDLIVEQDGAEVTVDGESLGVTPLEGAYYMAPGEHKYTVTLDGHTPHEEFLDLSPGEVASRQLRLDALPIVVKKGRDKKPKTVLDVASPSRTPLTIGYGVAGAMLVGAAFTAIQATVRHDRYQDESLSTESRIKAQDSGKVYSLVADILLGGGVLAAGYGTYYYYATYKPGKEEESKKTVWVTPYATGDGGGVAMGARF